MPDAVTLLAGLAEIRRACDTEDWDLVAALSARHAAQAREALELGMVADMTVVLEAQQALVDEMAMRRDAAAIALTDMRQIGRASQAYRRESD